MKALIIALLTITSVAVFGQKNDSKQDTTRINKIDISVDLNMDKTDPELFEFIQKLEAFAKKKNAEIKINISIGKKDNVLFKNNSLYWTPATKGL
jgi:hypothetical protein